MATEKTSVFSRSNWLRCLIASAALVFAANVASADNVWTYLAAGADGNPSSEYPCIVQGEWALLANSLWSLGNDIANGKYRVGRPLTWPTDGVLDLRNMSIVGYPGTDGAIAVTNMTFGNNNQDQYGGNPCAQDSPIVELYASHITQNSPFGLYSDNLRRVWLESDHITSFGGRFPSCTNVVLRFPNWTTIPQAYPIMTGNGTSAATLSGNVISDIEPPTLQYLYGGVSLSGATGKLVLTNVLEMTASVVPNTADEAEIIYYGTSLENQQTFRGASAMKNLTFIAPNCTNLAMSANYAWISVDALTNVVLYIPKVETVHSSWPRFIKSVWFQNEVLSRSIVNDICKSPGGSMRTIATYGTIYCSKKMGWKALASDMTDDEKAAAPDGCFGVFKDSNAYNQSYGMWMVHRDSPYERHSGLTIFVR